MEQPKIVEVTLARGRTVQPRKYESANYKVEISAAAEPGESIDQLCARIRAKVDQECALEEELIVENYQNQ